MNTVTWNMTAARLDPIRIGHFRGRHRRPLVASTAQRLDNAYLLYLGIAAAAWSFFYGGELAINPMPAKQILAKLQYISIVSVPYLVLNFTLFYTDNRFARDYRLKYLLIVPAGTLVAVWTEPLHGPILDILQLSPPTASILQNNYGPLFWVWAIVWLYPPSSSATPCSSGPPAGSPSIFAGKSTSFLRPCLSPG